MLSEIQARKLKDVFSKYKDIQAAYLFGSYAEGKENKFSDIDIGIVLDEVPIIMKFEVVKHNKLIYRRKDFNHPYYFSNIIKRGLGFKPFVKVQRRYYKERLLNGK